MAHVPVPVVRVAEAGGPVTVRIVLDVQISDDDHSAAAESLRETLAWVRGLGEHCSDYHEVIAAVAMAKARQHWQLAQWYREMERARLARKRPRKAPTQTPAPDRGGRNAATIMVAAEQGTPDVPGDRQGPAPMPVQEGS